MKFVYLHPRIGLICSEYRSKHKLHKILQFVNLQSTYILSVHSVNSKYYSREVIIYVHSVSRKEKPSQEMLWI